MSTWQKLLRSGSDGELNSLTVTDNVVASSFTGSLHGTSSYALTASYFDGINVSNFIQSVADVTWSFNHNLNNETPIITVWGSDKEVIVPQKIKSTGVDSVQIYFPVSVSGYAAASNGIIPTSTSTASYALTASFVNSIFSEGGTIADPINLISISSSFIVFRAPYSCEVVSLYGKKSLGSTAYVNARKSGSAGYLYHTGSNLSIPSDHAWFIANSIDNAIYSSGDSLEVIMSGSGNSQIAIQLDFRRI